MTPLYKVTAARPRDLDRLPRIEHAAARLLTGHAPESVLNETTSQEHFRDAQSRGHLWVALSHDIPVGFAQIVVLEPAVAHLEEIDVDPAHGRRGLGTRLVLTICEWAAAEGYRAVTLTTFRDLPWNMPFYARLGFEVIPTEELSPALLSVVRGRSPPRSRSGSSGGHAAGMRVQAGDGHARGGQVMRFARIVFIAAGVWGIAVLTPFFWLFDVTGGRSYQAPMEYPQFFYGFFSVAMAWQIGFLVIGSNPERFRPLMIPSMIEKFGYVATLVVLYGRARISVPDTMPVVPDLLLGILFVVAFAKTRAPERDSMRPGIGHSWSTLRSQSADLIQGGQPRRT